MRTLEEASRRVEGAIAEVRRDAHFAANKERAPATVCSWCAQFRCVTAPWLASGACFGVWRLLRKAPYENEDSAECVDPGGWDVVGHARRCCLAPLWRTARLPSLFPASTFSAQSCPLHVLLASVRIVCNAWAADCRFGARGGRCMLGCYTVDADDIRPCALCPALWEYFAARPDLRQPVWTHGGPRCLLLVLLLSREAVLCGAVWTARVYAVQDGLHTDAWRRKRCLHSPRRAPQELYHSPPEVSGDVRGCAAWRAVCVLTGSRRSSCAPFAARASEVSVARLLLGAGVRSCVGLLLGSGPEHAIPRTYPEPLRRSGPRFRRAPA